MPENAKSAAREFHVYIVFMFGFLDDFYGTPHSLSPSKLLRDVRSRLAARAPRSSEEFRPPSSTRGRAGVLRAPKRSPEQQGTVGRGEVDQWLLAALLVRLGVEHHGARGHDARRHLHQSGDGVEAGHVPDEGVLGALGDDVVLVEPRGVRERHLLKHRHRRQGIEQLLEPRLRAAPVLGWRPTLGELRVPRGQRPIRNQDRDRPLGATTTQSCRHVRAFEFEPMSAPEMSKRARKGETAPAS